VLKEVQFIKSESNYVSIHEADKRIMSLMRLSDLLDGQLPSYFQQVHRSYIANLNKVDKVQTNSIWIGKHEIPVSETYRKDLYAALNLDL
jgi:DNA-binding LytR/AlgR family response regulator